MQVSTPMPQLDGLPPSQRTRLLPLVQVRVCAPAGPQAGDSLPGGAVPQHWGVLERRRPRHWHGHHHVDGRHLHARLPVLCGGCGRRHAAGCTPPWQHTGLRRAGPLAADGGGAAQQWQVGAPAWSAGFAWQPWHVAARDQQQHLLRSCRQAWQVKQSGFRLQPPLQQDLLSSPSLQVNTARTPPPLDLEEPENTARAVAGTPVPCPGSPVAAWLRHRD